jgi:hypothetical protein
MALGLVRDLKPVPRGCWRNRCTRVAEMRIASSVPASAACRRRGCCRANTTVVLFEANDYLGGHTHTHDIELGGRTLDVDTGFIVHNPGTIRC